MIYKVFDELGKDITKDEEWVLTPYGDLLYFCEMTGEINKPPNQYTYQILQN
jgi:hypothetical protein